jgi:hypothetical protein
VYSQEYVMKLLREPFLSKAFETFLWEAKEDVASGDFMQERLFFVDNWVEFWDMLRKCLEVAVCIPANLLSRLVESTC